MRTAETHTTDVRARGFTLTEMVVAIGVVALLTVGVGQIFKSVSTLVSTGAGVAETDQIARTIRRQLELDFADMGRLASDETIFMVRGRRMGDLNNNGSAQDPGDIGRINSATEGLYLTLADAERDRELEVEPYELDTATGEPASTAVSVRLDEMLFLARSATGYESYQRDIEPDATSPYALIYYGHGLRPPLDTEFDPETQVARRLNYADGYFGATFGEDNEFAPAGALSTAASGRNEFAADFVLTRRPIVLMRSDAAGNWPADPNWRGSEIGEDGEFAPTPIDTFTTQFWSGTHFGGAPFAADSPSNYRWGVANNLERGYGTQGETNPNPRLLRHGRADVVALGVSDNLNIVGHLRDWLQGTQPYFRDGVAPFDAALGTTANGTLLWENAPRTDGSRDAYLENLRRQQTAIAALMHRPIVDPNPAALRYDQDLDWAPSPPQAFDARMDIHAILAERCSSFEVAWSNGVRWLFPDPLTFDRDRDPDTGFPAGGSQEIVAKQGDIVWFDMDFTYADFWREATNDAGLSDADFFRLFPRPNPDPEMGLTDDRRFGFLPGETPTGDNDLRSRSRALDVDTNNDASLLTRPIYSTVASGSRGNDNNDEDFEYLAVWGFQRPQGWDRGDTFSNQEGDTGAYTAPWRKPLLVRVRLTLHDGEDRLRGGKDYEFFFRLDPQD